MAFALPPLVAPVNMNRLLAVDAADEGAFEVPGLAPAEVPGLVVPVGLLVGRSASCTQPVTVMSLLCCNKRPADIVDCAATPPLNATTMAAVPIQMCRVFIRRSLRAGGVSSLVQDAGLAP